MSREIGLDALDCTLQALRHYVLLIFGTRPPLTVSQGAVEHLPHDELCVELRVGPRGGSGCLDLSPYFDDGLLLGPDQVGHDGGDGAGHALAAVDKDALSLVAGLAGLVV